MPGITLRRCVPEVHSQMANSSRLQSGRLAYTPGFGMNSASCLESWRNVVHELTGIQLPLAGMSTTTGLGVRYGEGKHIIFVKNPEGFVKVCLTSSHTTFCILNLS